MSEERPEDIEEQLEAQDEAASDTDDGIETDSVLPFEMSNDSLGEMMAQNFIQYASYVIKDRAIPELIDGLKPVQRRILHSLNEIDDGRFHKVANVIGNTMKYHPHGDASIGSALVVLANKEYFIDRQGNFGNIFTGDQASAPRYIECRLTELAREVLFNNEITDYVDSYDGRNKEPVAFPAKVPVLLMLGADGIAVGMSTRIMPHNFAELLKAQIAILKDKPFRVYPDFFTGGTMDASEYEDGNGRIKLRARIDTPDNKTLVIREVPATTNTESLMNSVEEAARKGKIKITSIDDYTTDKVEIEIKLPRGVYAEDTKKRLFAYTDCEVGISTSLIVIKDNRPEIISVSDILRFNTDRLVKDLQRELQIELGKLQERFHDKTLAQIFIEERIYKRIEESETYESILAEVRAGLTPFSDRLRREITDDDIEHLLQIQIRRISLFDINKSQAEIDAILKAIEEVKYNLENLTDYAINYVENLLEKYGKQYPRRTIIKEMERISVREVALKNVKVGHDRVNHFVGSDVKNSNKNEEPLICTEFDRLILLQNNGKFKVVPIQDRLYVGQIKHLLTADRGQAYCMIYRHRKTGRYYVKRFKIDRYIMNRTYSTMPKDCIIENLYTNYGVVVRAEFKHKGGNEGYIDIELDEVEMRSTGARGFKITDREIASFTQIKRGTPTPPTAGNDEDEEEDATMNNSTEAAEGSGDTDDRDTERPDRDETEDEATENSTPVTDGEDSGSENNDKKISDTPDSKTDANDSSGIDAPEAEPPAKSKPARQKRSDKGDAKNNTSKKKKKKTTSSAPAASTDKPDDPSIAEEWSQRSAQAAKVPDKDKQRIRIDEETPFFLE